MHCSRCGNTFTIADGSLASCPVCGAAFSSYNVAQPSKARDGIVWAQGRWRPEPLCKVLEGGLEFKLQDGRFVLITWGQLAEWKP